MADEQPSDMPVVTAGNFVADIDLVSPNGHYSPHFHTQDQLAWAQGGGMRVRVEQAQWQVTAAEWVWIPAHHEHEVWIQGAESLLSLYLDPELRPRGARWRESLVLPADEVAGTVFRHLCSRSRSLARQQHGYVLIRDILENTEESTTALAMPNHPAARRVAVILLADPAMSLSLDGFAEEIGVSTKTLGRAFVSDTGLTFTQWRLRARMQRAARLLADGVQVQEVAGMVGYATPTGFIKAYRQVYRSTPAAHAGR